jgi:hypothetical protein
MKKDIFVTYIKNLGTPFEKTPEVLLLDSKDLHLSSQAVDYCQQNGATVFNVSN